MGYHKPAMLAECLEGLDIVEGGTYIDMTFGGGGHSRAILEKLGNGRLFAFDKDADAEANIIEDERFMLIRQDFKYAMNYMHYNHALPVDGILADLGVSSHQFDSASRGFSIRFDNPLDMRMSSDASLTAADVLQTYAEEKLSKLFFEFGELTESRKIARAIVSNRGAAPIDTTTKLIELLKPMARKGKENQFYARVFQALRIEVNQEMESLRTMLNSAAGMLREGGRLVVISYHSLEDRMVKNLFKKGNTEGVLEKDFFGNPNLVFNQLHGSALMPTDEETASNSRARSAKLRIAEKIG